MSIRPLTLAVLLTSTLGCAAAFAEEPPEMQNRLVHENHVAMQHYAQEQAQLAQHNSQEAQSAHANAHS